MFKTISKYLCDLVPDKSFKTSPHSGSKYWSCIVQIHPSIVYKLFIVIFFSCGLILLNLHVYSRIPYWYL